jgi:hypothetical protein
MLYLEKTYYMYGMISDRSWETHLPILQGQSLYYHGKNSSRSIFRNLDFGGKYVNPLISLTCIMLDVFLRYVSHTHSWAFSFSFSRDQLLGRHFEWYGLGREDCAMLSTRDCEIHNSGAKRPECRRLWSYLYDQQWT